MVSRLLLDSGGGSATHPILVPCELQEHPAATFAAEVALRGGVEGEAATLLREKAAGAQADVPRATGGGCNMLVRRRCRMGVWGRQADNERPSFLHRCSADSSVS